MVLPISEWLTTPAEWEDRQTYGVPTPISREEARARGMKRYFTGKACSKGHVAERYVSHPNGCVECSRIRNSRKRKGAASGVGSEEQPKSGGREIISREAARERGFKRFFTGKPCRHGHVAERYVSSRACVECEVQRVSRRRSPAATTSIDNEVDGLLSKEEAQAQGLRFYFNGTPCKRGHVAKRYVCSGRCHACHLMAGMGPSPVTDMRMITRARTIQEARSAVGRSVSGFYLATEY